MHVFNGQSNAKMIIAVGLDLLMKLATSCFVIPFIGTSTRYAHPHCALCVRVCIYVNGCVYRVEEPHSSMITKSKY